MHACLWSIWIFHGDEPLIELRFLQRLPIDTRARVTGAVARLTAPSDDYVFSFTHVELYGAAHLTLNGTGTTLRTQSMYGDDTGHLHIGPGHKFELTDVCVQI